jgi:hypothetical protein
VKSTFELAGKQECQRLNHAEKEPRSQKELSSTRGCAVELWILRSYGFVRDGAFENSARKEKLRTTTGQDGEFPHGIAVEAVQDNVAG